MLARMHACQRGINVQTILAMQVVGVHAPAKWPHGSLQARRRDAHFVHIRLSYASNNMI